MIRAPATAELLDAWDVGSGLHRLARSGPLLHLVAGIDPGAVGELGIGDRDRLLVESHAAIFGPSLLVVAECPSCGIVHELSIATADLLQSAEGSDVIELDVGSYHLCCRIPRAADLVDAAATGTAEGARELLLGRTVLSAARGGLPVAPSDLPAHVVGAAATALADADPLVNADVAISCDACGESWTRVLDVDDYLWCELDAWAARTLQDIHLLATAYGWSEAQVLAVSPRRRRRYLELAGHG